jgi:hypothetical protein
MKILEVIRHLRKPADDRCVREEFGWVSQYPIEKTIQDFIKELRENPDMYK